MLPASAKELRQILPVTASVTLADPYPGGLGFRASGQIHRWVRIHTGVSFSSSETADLTNWGVGGQLLHPEWEVSPFVGLTSAIIFQSGTSAISSFGNDGWHIYPTIGIDWQSPNGFAFQVGYHMGIRADLSSSLSAAIGWSFPL